MTVTVICPDVAPAGTAVTIAELVELVTTAVVPLNSTVSLAGVVSNPVPVMVTTVPAGPLAGEIAVMAGIIVKFVDDVAVWL